ncbi:MAG: Gfo/Idh/MocA family oxidoreductase [Candidatus Omnitrophica bacterium]|nr:Gfo/Idh/MocA family oxidoreductase [Candidatus Omnitrophota bacterium]
MKRWSAAVIGLGNIGMGYDYDKKGDSFVLTHASGFCHNKNYRLVAGVDTDAAKRRRFEKKYKAPAFSTVGELYRSLSPEIISIAVPTPSHYKVFGEVVKHKPVAVICEKPMSYSSVKAMSMIEKADKAGCRVIVNYMRITEPAVIKLKEMISSGRFGNIYKGTVLYSKGLFNNCSHYINLLEHLIGNANEVKLIRKGRRWGGIDPEPDFYIKFRDAAIYFIAAKEENYSVGELELIGSKAVVRYGSFGYKVEYRPAGRGAVAIKNDLDRHQHHLLNELAGCLAGRRSILNSSGPRALQTLKTMESILKKEGTR